MKAVRIMYSCLHCGSEEDTIVENPDMKNIFFRCSKCGNKKLVQTQINTIKEENGTVVEKVFVKLDD